MPAPMPALVPASMPERSARMSTVVAGVRHFLLALQFFTRVPVTGRLAGWVGYSPAMLRASAAKRLTKAGDQMSTSSGQP